MLVLALCAWFLVSAELNLDRDYPGNNDVEEAKALALIGGLFFLPIVALLTLVVGGVLQVALGKRSGVRSAKVGSQVRAGRR